MKRIIYAAMAVLTLTGCGVQKAIDDMTPNVTILNVPNNSVDCTDCPGYQVNDMYAVDIGAGQWAIAIGTPNGCADATMILSATAGMWACDTGCTLVREAHLGAAECVGNLLAWYPLNQPCVDMNWCGSKDPWVSITIETTNGYVTQTFIQPGGKLPLGG